MESSIQIRNKVKDLDERIAKASAEFASAEGDAKDALRDQINDYKGQQRALNDMLDDVLAEEDRIRRGGGVPLAAPAVEPKAKAKAPKTVVDYLMGPRDEFRGLKFGDTLTFDVKDAYTDFGLPGIQQIDYSLPRQTSDALPNFGFLDSLPTGTTQADILTYFEKNDEKYKNAAEVWTPGHAKPSSTMGWKQTSAYIETIAHLIPVLEQQLKDYGQLQSLIGTELLFGLRMALAGKVLTGNDTNGIKGVLKNEGIQKYASKSGDTLADSVYRMGTDVFIGSGYQPTHVAMHPYVAESLALEKDKQGRYMNVMVNGRLWALSVVEDMHLTETTGAAASQKTTYGVLTYWNQAATVFTKETDSIAIGLVGDQFAYNEATLRAEGRHGLKVTYPKAFSYLADSGITR
jgi:HK97 family phage major capsid protein